MSIVNSKLQNAGEKYDLAAIERHESSSLSIRNLALLRHLNQTPKLRHSPQRGKGSEMNRTYRLLKCSACDVIEVLHHDTPPLSHLYTSCRRP